MPPTQAGPPTIIHANMQTALPVLLGLVANVFLIVLAARILTLVPGVIAPPVLLGVPVHIGTAGSCCLTIVGL